MQRRIGNQPHGNGTGMPATGDQTAKVALRSCCGIGVKPLRVIGIGKLAYLGFADSVRSSLYGLSNMELGELHSEPNRGACFSRSAECRLKAMSILPFIMWPPASCADATMG